MAYAQRTPDRNRTTVVTAVAGLHGMPLYGLVTGLGVDYVKDAVAVLQGRHIPVEVSPPPKQPPEQMRVHSAAQPANAPVITAAPNRLVPRESLPAPMLAPLPLPSTPRWR